MKEAAKHCAAQGMVASKQGVPVEACARLGMTFGELVDDLLGSRILGEVDRGHTFSRDLSHHMRGCISMSCMADWEERTYWVSCPRASEGHDQAAAERSALLEQANRAMGPGLSRSIYPDHVDVSIPGPCGGALALRLRGTGMAFHVHASFTGRQMVGPGLRECRVTGAWVDDRAVCPSDTWTGAEVRAALERTVWRLPPAACPRLVPTACMPDGTVAGEAGVHHETVASLRRGWARACKAVFPRGADAYVLPLTRLAHRGCACVLLHVRPRNTTIGPQSIRVFFRRARDARYEAGFSRFTVHNDRTTARMHRALVRRASTRGPAAPVLGRA